MFTKSSAILLVVVSALLFVLAGNFGFAKPKPQANEEKAKFKSAVAAINKNKAQEHAFAEAIKSKNTATIARIMREHGFSGGQGGVWQVNGFCVCWEVNGDRSWKQCACANGDFLDSHE